MAPAIEAVRVLSSVRAGPGNATRVSPARARRCAADRLVRDQQKASARPGGCKAPAGGGAGAGRGLWPPAGQGSAWRCGRGDGPCHCSGETAFARYPGGKRKRDPRFPARVGRCPGDRQVREHQRPAPGPAGAKRPPGAGRALAGGFGPRLVKDQRGTVAGAMAPAREAGAALSPLGRDQETRPAVPPPSPDGVPKTGRSGTNTRPAPDPAGAKRPPWAGRALAGGFGPRLAKEQPGAVAGAMAPAIAAVTALSPVRAGPGNASRGSPARAQRQPADQQVCNRQRPAPVMGGGALSGAWALAGPLARAPPDRGDAPRQTAQGAHGRVTCFPASDPCGWHIPAACQSHPGAPPCRGQQGCGSGKGGGRGRSPA